MRRLLYYVVFLHTLLATVAGAAAEHQQPNSATLSLSGGAATVAPSSTITTQEEVTQVCASTFGTTTMTPPPTTQSLLFDQILSSSQSESRRSTDDNIFIIKRDGRREELSRNKLLYRLQALCEGLDTRFVKVESLTDSILMGVYPNVTCSEIDILAAETAASMSTQHTDYARLASRIRLTANHKQTPNKFSEAMQILCDQGRGFVDVKLASLVQRHANLIDSRIDKERDFDITYFGFKTLERAYLLRSDDGAVIERPQYLMMRVALGIHCTNLDKKTVDGYTVTADTTTKDELKALEEAFATYELMSQGFMTHAFPTLFHAGTTHPQLSSCFLVQMSEDSITGIYDTLKRCAEISKAAGGIGLSVHNIRARGTPIKGTRGMYCSNLLGGALNIYGGAERERGPCHFHNCLVIFTIALSFSQFSRFFSFLVCLLFSFYRCIEWPASNASSLRCDEPLCRPGWRQTTGSLRYLPRTMAFRHF